MNKFQLIVLGIFGALFIFGVFGFSLYKGSSTQGYSVSIWGTLNEQTISDLLSAAGLDSKSGYTVTYKRVPEEQMETQLLNALASGVGPDMVIAPHEQILNQRDKFMLVPYSALPLATFESTYISGLRNAFESGNGLLGVPLSIDPLVLYSNTRLLSVAGFTQPPATWDDVSRYSQSLTKRNGLVALDQSGVALGGWDNIKNAKDIISAMLLETGNEITPWLNNSIVSNLANGSMESAVSFYTSFQDPTKSNYSWNAAEPNSQTAFLSEKTAMYIGYASEYAAMQAQNPNLNIAVSMFPQIAGQALATYGRVYTFAIPTVAASNAGPSIAVALVLSQVGGTAGLLDQNPSVNVSILTNPPTNSVRLPVIYKSALWAHTWYDPDYQATKTIWENMIKNITSGRLTVENAARQADSQLSNLLQ